MTKIACGYDHTLALRADGTVVAFGDTYAGATTVPAGLNGVVAVSAGSSTSFALKSDGTVVAWGDNTFNEISPTTTLSNIIS
ncbi:hypothetical protein ABTK92_20235, partial [Acinetobacter baumannii]